MQLYSSTDRVRSQKNVRGVMVIVIENGHRDTSSNPRRD